MSTTPEARNLNTTELSDQRHPAVGLEEAQSAKTVVGGARKDCLKGSRGMLADGRHGTIPELSFSAAPAVSQPCPRIRVREDPRALELGLFAHGMLVALLGAQDAYTAARAHFGWWPSLVNKCFGMKNCVVTERACEAF
jgi:hypothetical protein